MNGKTVLAVSVVSWFVVCCCSLAHAAGGRGRWGVGVNSPGVGLRYATGGRSAVELRGQFEDDVTVGGLRGYRYFGGGGRFLPFAGVEADIVSFKGKVSEGSGFAGELFAGGEYFFARRFSFQMDLGPAYVSLSDNGSSASVSGLEYVVNFGVNYYFGELLK